MTLFRALPDNARSKYSKIEQAADQFRQLQSYAHNRATEIRKIFGINASIDPAERRQLENELKDHEKALKDASENYRAAAAVYTAVRNWLEHLAKNPPGRALEDAPEIKPPLRKGEGLLPCLARLRNEIGTIKSVQRTTTFAPLPPSDLKRQAARYVEQMAASAKPVPSMGKDGQFTLGWFGGTTPTVIPPAAVFAMQCAVDPAQATRFLEDVIDTMPQPSGLKPLSAFDRAEQLKELGAQLDRLEREEEACVMALHAEGTVNITRRPDASLFALLGIQYVKPTSLKPVPRRPAASGNGEHHQPGRRKRARVRVRPKQSREDDRAARH